MAREVWITGIGLASSLGEGLDAHWQAMVETERPQPVVDRTFEPPFSIHPMVPLDLDKQIPKRADQRQMETWQRLGTYTAGLALEDAGIAGNLDILGHTHAVVAADGGARDETRGREHPHRHRKRPRSGGLSQRSTSPTTCVRRCSWRSFPTCSPATSRSSTR